MAIALTKIEVDVLRNCLKAIEPQQIVSADQLDAVRVVSREQTSAGSVTRLKLAPVLKVNTRKGIWDQHPDAILNGSILVGILIFVNEEQYIEEIEMFSFIDDFPKEIVSYSFNEED